MTTLAIVVVVLLWLVWLQRAHRKDAWLNGPNYVQQIQILKAETPLPLPPVKPLLARTQRVLE